MYAPRPRKDKLKSYGVAKREVLLHVEQRDCRYLNNRAENSHRPTRRREPQMQRSRPMRQAQRFLSAHAFISGQFHQRRLESQPIPRCACKRLQVLEPGDVRQNVGCSP